MVSNVETANYIKDQLQNSKEYKGKVDRTRQLHCARAAEGDFRTQLSQDGSRPDALVYRTVKKTKIKQILAGISGRYFNEGFKDQTDVDLYQYGVGDQNKDIAAEGELFRYLFKRYIVPCALFGTIAFVGSGIGFGSIFGTIGMVVGAALGAAVAVFLAPLAAYWEAERETEQSKYNIEQRSTDRGAAIGEYLNNQAYTDLKTQKSVENQPDNNKLPRLLDNILNRREESKQSYIGLT